MKRMITSFSLFVLIVSVSPFTAQAQDDVNVSFSGISEEEVVESAITREGEIQLILTDSTLTIALGPKVMNKLDRELDTSHIDTSGDDAFGLSWLGGVIEKSVKSALSEVKNLRVDCELKKIKLMEYRQDQIIITYYPGVEPCFDDVDFDDGNLFDQFPEEDAKQLVRAFQGMRGI